MKMLIVKSHALQYDFKNSYLTVGGHTTDDEDGEKLGDSKGYLNLY